MKNDNDLDVMPYHYTESGLDNVFVYGITRTVDSDGDEVIVIPNVNELHCLIASNILDHLKNDETISSQELRFLRTEMGLPIS